jgi:CelD/BcsL family acetyltransferase involved in cellulose biosynthesis
VVAREDARWARLVERAPAAMIFHHPAWLGLVARQYRYPLDIVAVEGADGELRAGLPVARIDSRLTGRRLVALPFSDECPPLLADPEAGPELAEALRAHVDREALPLELRGRLPELGGREAELFWVHTIDLDGDERPSSATRRNVNKARKAGVTVSLRTDRAALDAFYALHLATRRRQGVPTQPLSFIRRFEELFAQGLGFVALAELDGATAAAAVFLGAGPTLTYKYGASDRAALHARPNNLLFAAAIEQARERGHRHLDLGRTDFDNDGLRRFKASWGAREERLAYTYLHRDPPEPGHSRAERALAAVITRAPPVAGRAIGAALYRHAG